MKNIRTSLWTNVFLSALALLLVIFLIPAASVSASDQIGSLEVTGSPVNIRSGPSTDYEIVTSVHKGAELPVFEEKDNWYKVRLDSGSFGWISGEYSEFTSQDEVVVKVNDHRVSFDIPPYIDENYRTMVPIRFVANELGAEVEWDAENRQVIIELYEETIILEIGKRTVLLGEEELTIDTEPVLKEKRTMVPLRFVSEALGADVNWEGDTRTAFIVLHPLDEDILTLKIAEVTGSVVNVREGPGLGYRDFDQVEKGMRLEVAGEDKDGDGETWYKVMLSPDKEGWIAGRLVDITLGEEEYVSVPRDINREALILGSTVNVRSGPGLSFEIISRVEKGDIVGVVGKLTDWYKVKLAGGSEGWIYEPLVALRSSSPSRGDPSRDFGLEEPYLEGKTVVLDPGHGSLQSWGGIDPGAIGPSGVREVDVVMEIARKTADFLTDQGADVILTRTGNTSLSLAGRAQLANEANADVFVSIHADAAPNNSSASGTGVFYNTSLHREDTEKLARLVQYYAVEYGGRNDRGIRESNFKVLVDTEMPSILIETAFLTNPEEEKLLTDKEFQSKIAQGIAHGITAYFADRR